ncbi:hypothetical protein Achl_4357 (plasmid) [Pseudarthrobacter chlorophenolicus A6]|uniref:Uncharacterized protein n=1 Tax=Pseudarthrobacter chlorophenolicus (strain ATCC 700700 / DSM 12829 / CIP 107037 / JCM 12360 / KCTC 9906 / NCIMB 13794 / A6) TaxID=452863 RepID=B8HIR1_PSECP|nr:hypothetical protein [Pseudarthrobacter chlorophenolicus]ACL42308.1 hypothetical protein Achl_4357 [Pseudarthrobacter chlorophenolicus A6]SDQ16292.1 hypothetical protein SAMN04489738_0414 [Pseudarthrobacter chlorophenolicus]
MENHEFFTVTSTIGFRPYRVPPRCRKARPVQETFTHEFRIPRVTSEEAPVVALVPDDRGYLGSSDGDDAPLRSYNGQLYTAVMGGRTDIAAAGSDRFPSTAAYESWSPMEFEAIQEAGRKFEGILVVDGQVWKTTSEPSYKIETLGMGGNHGGTLLEVSFLDRGNPGRQFPLTEYEHAVASAIEFANKRGDTNSIKMIRETPRATILDPSAFKIPTQAQRLANAEEQARALVVKAAGFLAGATTHDSLWSAKKLIEEADSLMYQHGLDEVAAAGANT